MTLLFISGVTRQHVNYVHDVIFLYFSVVKYKNCLTNPLSNEHVQYYKFMQRVNTHFNKDSQESGGSMDEVLEEYIVTCRENGRNVENLFELWNNGSRAEDYKWNIEEETKIKDSEIIIKILETKQGMPTSGGSSFTFLQTSAHTKSFCPITDLFNGFYLVKCFLHENVTNIKGEVNFVNFTGFTKNKIKIHKVIFAMKTDVDYHKRKRPLCDDPERGYWVQSNNSWHWFTGSHVIPESDGNKLNRCVEKYSRVSTFQSYIHWRTQGTWLYSYENRTFPRQQLWTGPSSH